MRFTRGDIHNADGFIMTSRMYVFRRRTRVKLERLRCHHGRIYMYVHAVVVVVFFFHRVFIIAELCVRVFVFRTITYVYSIYVRYAKVWKMSFFFVFFPL